MAEGTDTSILLGLISATSILEGVIIDARPGDDEPTVTGSGIFLGTATIAPSSTSAVDGQAEYVYNVDLTATPDFVLIGNFQASNGTESDYSSTYTAAAGDFLIDPTNGAFGYQITLADALAAGLTTATVSITGTDTFSGYSGGSLTETETIVFNFTICFAAGTDIATAYGDRPVETLKIGDLVRTADGRDVAIKWIGRTTVNPMFNPADRLEPVRIRKGALGANTPNKDLIVTADHGMILNDMVINAAALVNGSSIDWYPWKQLGAGITYYHIETEDHDVILANGAESETYLDIPDRQSFDNYDEYLSLYGAEQRIPEMKRHRIASARLLPQKIRDRLDIRNMDLSLAM